MGSSGKVIEEMAMANVFIFFIKIIGIIIIIIIIFTIIIMIIRIFRIIIINKGIGWMVLLWGIRVNGKMGLWREKGIVKWESINKIQLE